MDSDFRKVVRRERESRILMIVVSLEEERGAGSQRRTRQARDVWAMRSGRSMVVVVG